MKRGVCILWMVMAWLQTVCAGEWQWAVTLKGFVSDETKKEPEAFLWVPAHCERLSAVMWSQQNMTEEMLFDMPSFRDSLAEMGVGLIWIAPGIDQQWDVCKGTQKVFDQMVNDLAEVSGYNGIPRLMIEGEYEWWEVRVNPTLTFRMMYSESCISFLCDRAGDMSGTHLWSGGAGG